MLASVVTGVAIFATLASAQMASPGGTLRPFHSVLATPAGARPPSTTIHCIHVCHMRIQFPYFLRLPCRRGSVLHTGSACSPGYLDASPLPQCEEPMVDNTDMLHIQFQHPRCLYLLLTSSFCCADSFARCSITGRGLAGSMSEEVGVEIGATP